MKNKWPSIPELLILHIVPDSFHDSSQSLLGSTKDIMGRREYFKKNKIAFDEIVADNRNDIDLKRCLQKVDISKYSHAFFELMMFPQSMGYLRQAKPELMIAVRPINAELFHRFHLFLAQLKVRKKIGIREIWRIPYRFFLDFLCCRWSDWVLPISDWEIPHYWRFLGFKKKVQYLPYFLPDNVSERTDLSENKENLCVALMSTSINPILEHAARNFFVMVSKLGDRCPDWKFMLTGDSDRFRKFAPNRVELTGKLDDPLIALKRARVMAIFSDLGFGFKTKILEAVQCGCFILLPKSLMARLPTPLQPFCRPLDFRSPDSFAAALNDSCSFFPKKTPNSILKKQASSVLDNFFLGTFPGEESDC